MPAKDTDTGTGSEKSLHHVAIIMDGNGRWAERRGLSRLRGHRAGLEAVREVMRHSNEIGLRYLTLYAFSEENWNRPRLEVDGLMALLERFIDEELDEIHSNNIRIQFLGRRDRLRASVLKRVDKATTRTAGNSGLVVNFALSYGGRAEIVDAARRVAEEALAGRIDPAQLDEKLFRAHLYLPELPDPDLLIRTGGDCRISNFLLWQIAYAEIYTTDVMWPDFTRAEFDRGIEDFLGRDRRFGLTGAQLGQAPGGRNPSPDGSGQ